MKTNKDYYSNELIKNVTYTINSEQIKVESNHTIFVNELRPKLITLQQFLNKFKELDTERKNNQKLKIKGISKLRKKITNLHKDYMQQYTELITTFNLIQGIAYELKNKGIRFGFVDDPLLNLVKELKKRVDKYKYNSSEYTQYLNLYRRIETILIEKEYNEEECLPITYTL